jgi:hypothetical protein
MVISSDSANDDMTNERTSLEPTAKRAVTISSAMLVDFMMILERWKDGKQKRLAGIFNVVCVVL